MPTTALSPMEQIMQHAKQCGCMAIPTEEEAQLLAEDAKKGDMIAIERVVKHFYNMELPTTIQQRRAVGTIFEAYTKYIKPRYSSEALF